MGNIKILDCTLRDGGYVNNFEFKYNIIKNIINKLSFADIDIIECGFLSDVIYDKDRTLYNKTAQIKDLIGHKNKNLLYIAMIALGEKEIHYSLVDQCDKQGIDGIRITFHEHEIDRAIEFAVDLMAKGYRVFIQPVGTTGYTDESLLKLISYINEINPYAFYLVDTLGTMYSNDLLRLFYLVDHNLKEGISIGFHSHNNLQLSFSNAQELLKLHTKRNLIIDASVFGMGRGAGNLCTELLTQYINDNIEKRYDVIPILEIVDEYLIPIMAQFTWGYSVPYYLASVNKCHPNYAAHLLNKQTITVKKIKDILNQIPPDERLLFNKKLVEHIYLEYQKHSIDDKKPIEKLKEVISGKNILVIAPGKTVQTQYEKITEYALRTNPFIISVNFVPNKPEPDLIFISNLKRFNSITNIENLNTTIFVTSNITTEKNENLNILNYADLLLPDSEVADNAGLMLLNLLVKLGAKEIYLAGFDGYSSNKLDNFIIDSMTDNSDSNELLNRHNLISSEFLKLQRKVKLIFITRSKYEREYYE